jgi:uncharacterized protein with NRDE domain
VACRWFSPGIPFASTSDNAFPDKPWQKSVQNIDRFDNIVKRYNNKKSKEKLVEELLCLLGDRKMYVIYRFFLIINSITRG